MTPTSLGTRSPASRMAFIAPMAAGSLLQNTPSSALSPCSLVIMHGSDIGRPWRARAFRKPSRWTKRASLRQPASIRCSFAIVTNGFVIDADKVGGQSGKRAIDDHVAGLLFFDAA